ncbi:MAG: zinc-binding dehydrogenase [Acidimicrobiia bacterium]|nr:zinc-binding dehydrogenase [Acidimicrobiia bacterium]MYB72529.1 zinc-binding dehydrogenase [Acidimicrobiia bacterium]MYI00615.1 zinc-binding dehydrogenase [Acidimicrobiia bacterium]
MRAVVFEGGQATVGEVDNPQPGHQQLLVAVRAAGLNGADLAQAKGGYAPPPGAPTTGGLEMAGEVVAAGEGCQRFSAGDRVMAVVQGGGQAELCVVDEPLAMPVPESLGWESAGGFPEVFATAHDALFTQAGLAMGERVCIHGAAGGVGVAAVQLAAATGAEVTATVRNPDSRRAVAELGANAIDPADFVEAGPFDVILELVGAPNWSANLKALAIEGRIMVIGVGAGAEVSLNLALLMVKRVRLFASTLRPRSLEQRATVARRVEQHVLPLVESGQIHVPIARTFPLAEAAAAYEYFAVPGKLGKVVLIP